MIEGKLEVTIKINELPQPNIVGNGLQQFDLNCDGRIISVTVKRKIYKKLTDAASNYLQWVAAMSNDKPRSVYALNLSRSANTKRVVLDEPNIQVFERKLKPKAKATAGDA